MKTKNFVKSVLFWGALLLLISVVYGFHENSDYREWSKPPKGVLPEDVPNTNQTLIWRTLGVGSLSIGNFLKQLAATYSIAHYWFVKVYVFYQSAVSFLVDIPYLQARGVDFLVSENYMDDELRKVYPDMTQYPIYVQPIVVAYGVPGFLPYIISNRTTECIVMDIPLLADIYMGYVTNWNDSRIREQNPAFVNILPNMTIVPMGYYGRETATFFLTHAFDQLAPRFHERFSGPISEWPVNGTKDGTLNPNLRNFLNGYATFAATQEIPGSLGYMTLYSYKTASGGTTPYLVIRYNDELQLPKEENTMALFQQVELNKEGILENIIYDKNTTGWPIPSVTYLHLLENVEQAERYCLKDRELIKFFCWALTDEEAIFQSLDNGFFSLPEYIRMEVKDRLERLKCYKDGEELMELQIINDHDNNVYFEILLCLGMVLGGISILFGCVFIFLGEGGKGKNTRTIVIWYSIILLFGAVMCYVGIIFFYLIPDESWICQFRIWLVAEGFSIFFGSIFTRNFMLHRFYQKTKDDKLRPMSDVERKRQSLIYFTSCVGSSIIIQTILLAVWTSVDTFKSNLSIIDEYDRTASWVCKSEDTWLWVGLEIAFFTCILFYGLIVVYVTWKFNSKNTEGKYMSMSIYNTLITLAMLLPIVATIEIKDDNLFIIASTGITFVVTSTLFLFYLPKFKTYIGTALGHYYDTRSTKGSSDSSSNSRSHRKSKSMPPADTNGSNTLNSNSSTQS